ncbi:unnamed protein product [Paramecium sonneborni]|uniref:Uncharacterized protein n=1 Tax=Paramecium sonneborni TaxID=65129 RepID=A0A8S1RTD6_9CILI|nr:unnamed protein product [Paramecium sonneborni]
MQVVQVQIQQILLKRKFQLVAFTKAQNDLWQEQKQLQNNKQDQKIKIGRIIFFSAFHDKEFLKQMEYYLNLFQKIDYPDSNLYNLRD